MDQQLISFYASPEINSKRIKFSSSISTQIYLNKRKSPQPLSLTRNNYFDILQSVDPDDITMTTDMDTETNDRQTSDATSIKHPQAKQYEVVSWTLDSSITEISEDIFSEIQQQKKLSDYAGETEHPSVSYKAPKDTVNTTKKLNQHIRFNLIRHWGTNSDIPTLKLFKSFSTVLCYMDLSLIILPYQASKQHYSSLTTLKQISSIDDHKMLQFLNLIINANIIPLVVIFIYFQVWPSMR